jgi:hypothetical protein
MLDRASKRDKKIRSNSLVRPGSSVENSIQLKQNGNRRSPGRTLLLRAYSPERFVALDFLFLLCQDKRKEKFEVNRMVEVVFRSNIAR